MTAAEHPLIREYRPSMDKDTLHDWAVDAVAEMRKCHAIKADLLEAATLAEDIIDDFLGHLSPDEQVACKEDPKASVALKALRAAISKATGQ